MKFHVGKRDVCYVAGTVALRENEFHKKKETIPLHLLLPRCDCVDIVISVFQNDDITQNVVVVPVWTFVVVHAELCCTTSFMLAMLKGMLVSVS